MEALRAPLAFLFVAVYTLFTLFLARNVPTVKALLISMSAMALLMTMAGTKEHARYLGGVLLAVLVYATVLAVTAWLGAEADLDYLRQVGPYIGLALLVPSLFAKFADFDPEAWRKPLLILFGITAVVIMGNSFGLLDYNGVRIGSLSLTYNNWIEKYYVYWLILLTWGCVSFCTWRQRIQGIWISGLIATTIALILTSGRSDRAPAIFLTGLGTYLALTFWPAQMRVLKVGVWLITLMLFCTPWLLRVVDIFQMDAWDIERTLIYRASYDLTLQKLWSGHGFGSTQHLKHPELPAQFEHGFPGGHPHNLALLFWLESGVLGALFLCGTVWFMLMHVVRRVAGRETMPAAAALIISFVVMVTFSWSIWYLEILLFYAMFAGLVLLVTNIAEPTHSRPTHEPS